LDIDENMKNHKGDRDLMLNDYYNQIDHVDEELSLYQDSMKEKHAMFKKLE
jgi:hypothetical protein